jgi:hypothetical protein
MIGLMLPIITTLLALFYLAKDWDAHRKSWRRLMVLVLIIFLGITGTVNTYYSNRKNDDQRREDQKQIAALQKAVATANTIQEGNTRQFVKAFGQLSEKLNVLETKVKSAGLKEEADRLRAQLESTEKALTPPKANLAFTFPEPNIDAPPVRSITLPVKNDVVHVEFYIMNTTDVTAIDGLLELRICYACDFASEPKKFIRVPGQEKIKRNLNFERMLPRSISDTLSANIRVPAKSESVEICVVYRCSNCDVPSAKANCGVVKLSR